MPMFNFQCVVCGEPRVRLLKTARDNPGVCPCGGALKRKPVGPSTQVVERLDNGLTPKVLERYSDAEELFGQRKDDRIREAKELRGEAPFEEDL